MQPTVVHHYPVSYGEIGRPDEWRCRADYPLGIPAGWRHSREPWAMRLANGQLIVVKPKAGIQRGKVRR